MVEELKYRISFTKGSLAGQLFPLGSESVIVGRSHTCGIRVMEPDVSGRHVLLSVGPKGVEMEVISSRRTMLDGKALKTGDQVAVRAGQTVAMGGSVAFAVECYRSDGDRTEAPGDWTDGMTRFGADAGGDDDATRRPGAVRSTDENSMTTPAGDYGGNSVGGIGDDDTGTHIPPPPSSRPRRAPLRPGPPPVASAISTGTVGTMAEPPFPPGGETLGTEALPPPPDATQIIQTRAATPQEMAYMRELHNKKRRKKLGLRIGLGVFVTAIAGGLCVWLAWHPPEPVPSLPAEKKTWKLLDSEMRPIPAADAAGVDNSIFLQYPAAGGWGRTETSVQPNPALGTKETVFSVKTRVGRDLDLPLRLRVIVYASAASLDQSQEESFADWDRTNNLGLEKQAPLATDFVGVAPGIPCLRYTYTRKATPEEERADGVLDWAGVLSFARFRDTCIVYLREVPSVEELRAEYMLTRSGRFLGISAPLVRSRWMGRAPHEQAPGDLPILRNSARELIGKNMDNEWEELETKLTTILIRTYPNRARDPDAARLYDEALEWMGILRTRQDETWKKRCVVRFQATRNKNADTKRMDEGIRALFRSKDDRRHVTAQKEKWWEQ